ncbi:MAG: amidohydrolase family protein [Thermoproteota archaeon]
MTSLLGELNELIRSVGSSRLLFGSGIPLKYFSPALLKIKLLEVPEEIREKIFWRNASDLLRMNWKSQQSLGS